MSFLVAFRARIYPALVGVRALTARAAACGSRCLESLAKFGLHMSSPKTLRCFALADWTLSSKGLPTWGTMRRGACLELGTSARPIVVIGCGSLLPTPTCAGNENSPSMQKWQAHRRLANATWLPTPLGSDLKGQRSEQSLKNGGGLRLTEGLLPTPVARDHRHGGPANARSRQGSSPLNEVAHRQGVTGGVFIALREWMMGWPLGWSASEPLATDRFQQWLRSHGAR
jgi:hypothetical protein